MNKIQIEELTKEELIELLHKIIREEAEKLQPDHEELITREEVAGLFRANKDTIKNWTMRGFLKGYYIGKRVYYKRGEVYNALKEINTNPSERCGEGVGR
jgi:restriction endonuclease S subunit